MANYQSSGWNHRVLVGIKMARRVWSLLPVSQSLAVEYHLRTCGQPELQTKNMAYTVAKPIED